MRERIKVGIIKGRSERITSILTGNRGIEGGMRLTNPPTPIEGIDEFVYSENSSDPSNPTGDVHSCSKGPILPSPRDTRSDRIRICGDSKQWVRYCWQLATTIKRERKRDSLN